VFERNPRAMKWTWLSSAARATKLRDPGKRLVYGALRQSRKPFVADAFALEPDLLFNCRQTPPRRFVLIR